MVAWKKANVELELFTKHGETSRDGTPEKHSVFSGVSQKNFNSCHQAAHTEILHTNNSHRSVEH